MAEEKGYGSGKPLSVTESRNRRRKSAGLAIRPEPGKMPDKKPGKRKTGMVGIMPVPKPTPKPPKPTIYRPTTPKQVPPKARGAR